MGDFDLTGRVAIVTGGNGGIGLGMADALARAGCAVSIWGRNAEKNAHALAQLRAHGGAVEVRQCDVSDRSAVEAAFAATLAEFARVDACFANAGIGGGGRKASSSAPRRNGGKCSPSISTACFTCFNLPPAI